MENNWLTIESKKDEIFLTECTKEAFGEIVIPQGVSIIKEKAFQHCQGITSVIMPDSVKTIGTAAFRGCRALKTIQLSNNITEIGSQLFRDCVNLSEIALPNNIVHIGNFAILVCERLKSIIIPAMVRAIGFNSFSGTSLTSITIPKSVTFIEEGAFCNCQKLERITVEEGNPEYDSRDNCNAIIETSTDTLIMSCAKTTVPDSVKHIGEDACCSCMECWYLPEDY